MYEFTVLMPYKKEHIDNLFEINQKVEKSCIKSVCFSLPTNSSDFTGFEQERFVFDYNTDFNYWEPLIEHSLSYGADFIYLLNSKEIFDAEIDNIDIMLEKLDKLLNNIIKLGCNKVLVCNPQLIAHINEYYKNIEIYLSSSTKI